MLLRHLSGCPKPLAETVTSCNRKWLCNNCNRRLSPLVYSLNLIMTFVLFFISRLHFLQHLSWSLSETRLLFSFNGYTDIAHWTVFIPFWLRFIQSVITHFQCSGIASGKPARYSSNREGDISSSYVARTHTDISAAKVIASDSLVRARVCVMLPEIRRGFSPVDSKHFAHAPLATIGSIAL